MQLASEAFAEGQPIPREYTCDGEDRSPPLAWEEAPQGTHSFAVICDDPDAPGGTFAHWAVFDIPPDVGYLEAGHSRPDAPGRFPEGANDFGRAAWGGPCPPNGHGTHHYHFRVLALGVASLDLEEGVPIREVERAARQNVLDESHLTGIYER